MLLWSHTGHNYTWFPMYRLLVHSRMTFFCRLVLTFKKVIVVPECFDCLWYLKAWSHTYHNWNCPYMFLLFGKSQTTSVLCFVLTLITIHHYPLMFRLFVHTQMTFLCCLVLTVITIRFDIHVFWFFINPKIDCFALSESSFVFLCVPCFDRMCTLRFLLVFALYSHWSQSNLMSPC